VDTATEARRLGRPPKIDSDGVATAERLLAAATAACVERGFEGATMADIARRARVSTPAIYNHFTSKAELLIAAGRWALSRIPLVDAPPDPAIVVRAFLSPAFADTRRLLVELHLAAARHPDLAALLATWHDDNARIWARRVEGPDRLAAAAVFFAFLLGLCQIDSLSAVGATRAAETRAAVAAAATMFDQEGRP
jgi:AcrR family transcriptional regulator